MHAVLDSIKSIIRKKMNKSRPNSEKKLFSHERTDQEKRTEGRNRKWFYLHLLWPQFNYRLVTIGRHTEGSFQKWSDAQTNSWASFWLRARGGTAGPEMLTSVFLAAINPPVRGRFLHLVQITFVLVTNCLFLRAQLKLLPATDRLELKARETLNAPLNLSARRDLLDIS